MKFARVEIYNIDSLPAHVTVSGKGQASDIKLAAGRALRSALGDPKLKGKRYQSFTVRVVVGEVVDAT